MVQRPLFVIVALFLAVLPAGAQQRPDFSGTWTAVKDPPPNVGAAPGPIFGATFGLKQEGDSLTIVRTLREQPYVVKFPLDGREVRFKPPAPLCMGQGEVVETANPDGTAIVLTIVASQPAGAAEPTKANNRRTLKLESPDTLVAEGTIGGAAGAPPRTVGTVYKRSSEPVVVPDPRPAPKAATLAQVKWLAGMWVGTLGRNDIEERWTPAAGGSMMAISRTMRAGTMGQFEFLCLVERDGGLVYQAMPNGRQPATDFTLTAIDADSLTFENPAHDYPKMIKYVLKPDGVLEATISGAAGQRALSYTFKRQ